ncbi:hypothetical protein [Streptomyces sp. ISL-21]|uniref:hypothetical protein n=1 Tax=Streptomyces sp. ISL-21 TaxID=2819179 RepID=UPI002035C141|nr:hypothetical protein [Streptomyces sp. ISL-21]
MLLNRDLRPGTDTSRLSRFREDQWDLSPAVFEDHARAVTLNFVQIPAGLRTTAKYYVWQLLNHTEPRTVRSAGGARIAVLTVSHLFVNYLRFVLQWFAEQGVTALSQVTQELLDNYLDALIDDAVPLDRCYRRLTEVRRLWAYRNTLPAGMRLPGAPPWAGEDTHDLLGRTRGDRENRTRRIGEATMQMLLRWAIRFVEDFADDILTAHDEQLELHARMPEQRRATGTQAVPDDPRHRPGELKQRIAAYLDDLREHGEALPGARDENGELKIRWRHLAAILDCSGALRTSPTGRMVIESGLPIGEHTYLRSPITGGLDAQPWRHDRIRYEEAPRLARLLSTACFVIVSYLSGARVGEVLNLRRGCITHDEASGLWLMSGLYFKGAEDDKGNKIPEGRPRPDPWVVIEVVAHAVDMLERLHPHPLLFPRSIEPHYRQRWENQKRQGAARSHHTISNDLAAFVDWVNAHCAHVGRTDSIPDDGRGKLAPSRFRRTLAWFIRRRPRGLIAASIQYGHAHTRMLQGYAGAYESGFPDEYAFEDWLFRLEGLAEDEEALNAGENVSGPAAEAYRYRVAAANREFAGRVLTSDRQARDLAGNPLLQIHHGEGMTCVFNPATAACQVRGSADDPMVTPDLDDCRPKCPNLARTDRDIEHVSQRAEELAEIVADPLAPPLRHARERHELARLERIIDTHRQGPTAP